MDWIQPADKQPLLADLDTGIRRVLADHAHLAVDVDSVDENANLFRAGMGSHASVNVMLALEDTFDIEFPETMFKREVFESVASIAAAICTLSARAA